MPLIGYARPAPGEKAEAQLAALKAAGCARVYQDAANRGEWRKALAAAKAGDVLVVARLDRVARSVPHLASLLAELGGKGIGLRSLGEPVDTTASDAAATLALVAALAGMERAAARERTVLGLSLARARGRVGGNPGLRRGDPDAIAKVLRAREDRRSDAVAAAATDFLPEVRQMRGEGRTWDEIVGLLNYRKRTRPMDGKAWTRDSLIRAVRRLARDGLADKDLLKPTSRAGTVEDEDALARVVLLWKTLEKPTLLGVAAKLEEAGVKTPRGRPRWSAGSVKNLLDRAKAMGLVG